MNIDRAFRPLAAVLILLLAVFQLTSAWQESDTWDEASHLVAGYSHLVAGDYRLNPEHPPLANMLNAFPLLFLGLQFPIDEQAWKTADIIDLGRTFLYHNRVSADLILLLARSMTILATLLLALTLAWWTRKEFGPRAALVALSLVAFDPNLIAHGRYITTDMLATVFIFAACLVWHDYLAYGGRGRLIASGLLAGAAMMSKFSAFLLLPPLVVLLYLLRPARFSWRHMLKSLTVVGLLILACMAIVYLPELIHRPAQYSIVRGFAVLWNQNTTGHNGYLLGQFSMHGWWYYFPVAFAVKSTTAVVLLTILGLVSLARASWRRVPFRWTVVLVSALVYLGLSMVCHINIGIRHLLPMYPFLYVALGAMAAALMENRRWRVVLALLLGLHVAESVAIYPHYLAFFNFPSGGPSQGPRYLLDSNIDWGQDVKKLRAYLEAHHLRNVCSCYFGTADFAYHRMFGSYLPPTISDQDLQRLDCVAAVSVTSLYGLYLPRDTFWRLRQRTPMARVGYSIYLYDLRKRKDP